MTLAWPSVLSPDACPCARQPPAEDLCATSRCVRAFTGHETQGWLRADWLIRRDRRRQDGRARRGGRLRRLHVAPYGLLADHVRGAPGSREGWTLHARSDGQLRGLAPLRRPLERAGDDVSH